MTTIRVFFMSNVAAFSFVSEIRRRSGSLLWDLRVRRQDGGAEVLVPEDAWRHEPFIEAVATQYGGDVERTPPGPSDAHADT